jgi:hypothetical protein
MAVESLHPRKMAHLQERAHAPQRHTHTHPHEICKAATAHVFFRANCHPGNPNADCTRPTSQLFPEPIRPSMTILQHINETQQKHNAPYSKTHVLITHRTPTSTATTLWPLPDQMLPFAISNNLLQTPADLLHHIPSVSMHACSVPLAALRGEQPIICHAQAHARPSSSACVCVARGVK